MSHRAVEALIGRLATDSTLLRRFARAPTRELQALTRQGYELTTVEIDALTTIDIEALGALAQGLDRRLLRADLER